MSKNAKIISWIAAIISALIMLQTLYFKFSAAPESVYIFKTIGMEPYGRIGIGITELLASLLILFPSSRLFGAMLGLFLMEGAMFFHITKLGIVVMDDGGYLFILGLIVLICCAICLFIEKAYLKSLIKRVFSVQYGSI